jgi:hypothetical protein
VVNTNILIVLIIMMNHLGGEDTALLSSGSTTNDGGVSVEVLGDFLERSVTGFDVELPDDSEFETQPGALFLVNRVFTWHF